MAVRSETAISDTKDLLLCMCSETLGMFLDNIIIIEYDVEVFFFLF